VAQIPSKPGSPDDKMVLTHIPVVSGLTSSITWYRDILGTRFHSESVGTFSRDPDGPLCEIGQV
jgi:hypothetical protein